MAPEKKKRILIILAVLAIVVIVVILYFYYQNKNTPVATTSTQKKTTVGSDTLKTTSNLPTGSSIASGGGSTTKALPSATPTATQTKVGDLDWSKNQVLTDQSQIQLPANIGSVINDPNTDLCQKIGVSNDWSNPFEKTMCGMFQFLADQFLTPLSNLACNLSAASLAENYGSNITVNTSNGSCQIEDRK